MDRGIRGTPPRSRMIGVPNDALELVGAPGDRKGPSAVQLDVRPLPCAREPPSGIRSPTSVSPSLRYAGVSLLVAVAIAAGCRETATELPEPAQKGPELPEVTVPPPLGLAGPIRPVSLPESERAAIEQVRQRGASVIVSSGSGSVLVHFPLGQLERKWRKQGVPLFKCGMSIAYEFTPDDTGPRMRDADLVYLNRMPRLERVNLAGTDVTPGAIQAFRKVHPGVVVEGKFDAE
jgi:hypothetical protein